MERADGGNSFGRSDKEGICTLQFLFRNLYANSSALIKPNSFLRNWDFPRYKHLDSGLLSQYETLSASRSFGSNPWLCMH